MAQAERDVRTPKRVRWTRSLEAHFVVYRRLTLQGLRHDEAYALATQIVDDLAEVGLTVTKRRAAMSTSEDVRSDAREGRS